MKNNPEENKINPSKINVETARQIGVIIEKIDEKVIQLLHCSSEDFLNLNNHLKKYHSKVTEIADNIEFILSTIINENNQTLFNELRLLHKDVFQQWKIFNPHTKQLTTKQLLHQLKDQLVPINNLRQDLKSLKLLLTNLNLELNSSDELSEEVFGAVNSIDELFPVLDTHQKSIQSLIKKGESAFSDVKLEKATKLQQLFERFMRDIEHTFYSGNDSLQTLKEYKNQNKIYISNIVTNLQYQDIIRQKIEHIQEIHKDICTELSNLSQASESQLKNRSDFFSNIKDIAGLQAAQLIHTNQEYQNAIQIITQNLAELGENMEFLSGVCNNSSTEFSVCDLDQKMELITSIKEIIQNVDNPVETYIEFKESYTKLDNFKEIINTIRHLIDNSNSLYLKGLSDNAQTSSLLKGMNQTLDANEKNMLMVIDSFNKLDVDFSANAPPEFGHKFSNLKSKVQEIHAEFQKTYSKANDKIDDNKRISAETENEFQHSSESVKYYDLFEKVIEEIIDHLNTINLKLEYGDRNDKNKAKNLEHLRQKYTTASEHLIHEKVVLNSDFLGSDETSENNEDDDNLELF
jgi:hypothetical protein